MAASTSEELEALALRCVREHAPLWELVSALKEAQGRDINTVMFGECVDPMEARSCLHLAEMAAKRPYGWRYR